MRRFFGFSSSALILSLLGAYVVVPSACSESGTIVATDGGGDATIDGFLDDTSPPDATTDGAPTDGPPSIDVPPGDSKPIDASILHPCSLPGSIQFTSGGVVVVPGGHDAGVPDLGYIHLPVGFCVHYYGSVGNARQVRVAPGGELFVASPTTPTTGGGANGQSAIMVLPDDNHDGYADSSLAFLSGLPSTQGLMFTPGYFYFQDHTSVMRVTYNTGDRKPSGPSSLVVDISVYVSALHWPKTFDIADDGTIYVGNGGDQGEMCDTSRPFHGGILAIDGTPGGALIAKGLRNPIALRCARGHDQCFAVELSKDYSASMGGREKMFPIRKGDDWGFPCCATQNLPYSNVVPTPDCSAITPENVSFVIGDTPFGIDFEPGIWPGMWTGRAFVTTHGTAGGWSGARLVGIAMDPSTGLPMPASNTGGTETGGMADFATGWDDGSLTHGRPAAVTFSSDGRLFLANDNNGTIVWIASLTQ